MPLKAVRTASVARNGVGAFILPCSRLEFHYCDWAGSSRGMNSFLLHLFPDLAARSPSIAFHVSPRPRKHPVIRAHYINGATKSICVRNLEKEQVLQKVELLRDSSGVKNRKLKGGKFVQSANESVRGVWSGMHASAMNKDNIWGFNKTSQRS